jgi:hypothetical protein
MGSIPLPALDLRPVQQPDRLGGGEKLMALKSLMNQQQLQGPLNYVIRGPISQKG